MKTTVLLLFCILSSDLLIAQSPSFEFAYTGADTTAEGPTTNNQTVYFCRNSDNPSGSTFITMPSFIASFIFNNQQYRTGPLANQYDAGLLFGAIAPGSGGTQPAPYPLYRNMGAMSSPDDTMFTSIYASNGGIEVEDETYAKRNFAIELFADVKYLGTNSTTGKYYYGDLVINFSEPVSNAVLQIVGLGAQFSSMVATLGFSAELKLVNSGLTLSKLDGNTNLVVNGLNIENLASAKNATTGAATGSVLVSGSSFSSLTFEVYVEGDGRGLGLITWNTVANSRPGDGFLMGISLPDNTALPITLERFTTTGSNCKVKVDFKTGVEDNVNNIRLQHSTTQNGSFRDIYEWQPKGDNSSYQYLHSTSSPMNFYRLAVTDNDSSKSYSPVSFAAGCQRSFSIYPNPANNSINITGQFRNKTYRLDLFDSKGRLVLQTAITSDRDLYNLNISRLPPGNYYVLLKNADTIVLSQPLLKN